MLKSQPAPQPSHRQLRHWEAVCSYLDSQPFRAVKHPLPTEPLMSVKLFKHMGRFGLVRHSNWDCTYRLHRRWRAMLKRLWEGADEDEAMPERVQGDETPFIVDANADTIYVSLLAPDAEDDEELDRLRLLPAHLNDLCQHLKEKAQEEDKAVPSLWSLFGCELMMFKAGVGTKGNGKGVSWSYLFRNDYVMLLLRKAPLGRLLGSVRLSAKLLWQFGPQVALDGVRQLIREMWSDAQAFYALTFRLSQLHLAVDMANFAPSPADLDRVLTHSKVKAVHVPSVDDEGADFPAVGSLDDYLDDVPDEWDGLPLDFFLDHDEIADLDDADDDEEEEDLGDEQHADDEGATVYLYGKRASGFTFSPGSPLSAAWYNKELEERTSGKVWMREIHQAGGWQPHMSLFRVELRFMRPIMREMQNTLGKEAGAWLDDPWQAIQHYHDFWAYGVGLPPEHDLAPDVTHRGWMRLTLPQLNDKTRGRWPTDPVWHIIQRADFGMYTPPQALSRSKLIVHDAVAIDAEIYGLLRLRSVLHGRHEETTLTLSQELRAFANEMEDWDEVKNRDYTEEVREKARSLGRGVPLMPSGLLPAKRPYQRKRNLGDV